MLGTAVGAVGCAAGLGEWVKGLLPDTVPVPVPGRKRVWVTVIKDVDLDRGLVTMDNVLMTEEEEEKLRRENEKAVYVYANGDAPFVAYDQTGYYG